MRYFFSLLSNEIDIYLKFGEKKIKSFSSVLVQSSETKNRPIYTGMSITYLYNFHSSIRYLSLW